MRALDLFCCAGGATRGLQLAGFHVTGVDLIRSANYCGDVFVRADALAYLEAADLGAFDLIAPTRVLLARSDKPYCIENVVGAPLIDPTTLCGSMFGLRTPDGAELRRHRLFETSFPLATPSGCRHEGPVVGIYGAHVRDRRRPAGLNHCSGSNRPWEHAFIAMGVPTGSMTLAELSEAIPPPYSKWVAEQWLASGPPFSTRPGRPQGAQNQILGLHPPNPQSTHPSSNGRAS
jgi:DNA (cytosine-5)-methyltransferase 1